MLTRYAISYLSLLHTLYTLVLLSFHTIIWYVLVPYPVTFYLRTSKQRYEPAVGRMKVHYLLITLFPLNFQHDSPGASTNAGVGRRISHDFKNGGVTLNHHFVRRPLLPLLGLFTSDYAPTSIPPTVRYLSPTLW